MNKKDTFVKEIEFILEKHGEKLSEEAETYFNSLKMSDSTEKVKITANGQKILNYMIENEQESGNLYKAKTIAENLEISSRAVSGAIRKLVTDGYVEKVGDGSPTIYALTENGRKEKGENE